MFTNSALIIHGPPLNEEDHAKFPHVCLGLDREAARKLYRASFIGTRVNLNHMAIEKAVSIFILHGSITILHSSVRATLPRGGARDLT